ncbi:MAG: ADP-forming succinate--CoA ligase subunit beta [Bacteroidetes bacterium SW_10_40_5]|nr:MAG: ADP-forming succinate--CoA ligase subunit beta [Bacteroidetes bacterium SW_10_40_5]
MNIHEYQAKDILNSYEVPIQKGIVASTVDEAVKGAEQLEKETGTDVYVVKAQIHAGGRGKGGGVKLAKSRDELKEKASNILGMNLVTPQTGEEGKEVHQVYVTEDAYYPGDSEPQELYMSVLLDRANGQNIIMYSPEGGVDIEEVASKTPDKIFKEPIDPAIGIQPFQARRIAFNYGLSGDAFKHMVKFVMALYKAYDGIDASLFEVNPVLKTADNKVIAVDAKVNLDDNALYRHKDFEELRDVSEEEPLEVKAKANNLNYIKLDGNVGCMVNGAGLAMATMDMIKLSGGDPANFLDVGGAANPQTVEAGFRIIMEDPNVEAILVNIFGGIVRCDRVATGIVEACKNIENLNIPIIVRLQGTNAEEAKKIIDESGLKVKSAVLLDEAAKLVKETVG